LDNFRNSKPESLNRIREITGKDFKFYEADMLDRSALREIFSKNEISQVVHFAGLKAVGESVEKPLEYYHTNIEGTISLLEIMREFGVRDIVFSSSATVYGLENPSPLVETMPTFTATNPYGYTKVVIEQILRDIDRSENGWSITILRYFNPIGAHKSGKIGEDPQGIPNNLMPYITQVAIGKREKLQVFGNDYPTTDGTGVRDYIHVVDLAKGHLAALDKNLQKSGVKTYNLGTGKGVSVLELIQAFEKSSGQKIPFEIAPRRSGDIAECYADATKASVELNWRAEKTIEQMCEDSWRWQSQNPRGFEK
jgi:UDP-glucose 4-epimerase